MTASTVVRVLFTPRLVMAPPALWIPLVPRVRELVPTTLASGAIPAPGVLVEARESQLLQTCRAGLHQSIFGRTLMFWFGNVCLYCVNPLKFPEGISCISALATCSKGLKW